MNNTHKTNKLHTSFKETFGPQSRRTKPNLTAFTMEEFSQTAGKKLEDYSLDKDSDYQKIFEKELKGPGTKYITYGQSRRIFNELHKVIDSSDVVCTILDARDPMATRCTYVEKFIKKSAPHKHIVFILNKCDLIPTWATAAWVKTLSKEYPTVAFHASITNPFGKTAFFNLLKQFEKFHKDKKNISIGFVGYPNVGKSSIINTMKRKNVSKSSPIPGETKIWQYVTLTNRIYLIDCPGVVYELGDSETDKVLKGIVRAEKLEEPVEYVEGILQKAKRTYLKELYQIGEWVDLEDFLTQIANRTGKLRKGAEPDLKAVSKMVLMDWQRGKIPYFALPPLSEEMMLEEAKKTEEATTKTFKIEEQKFADITSTNKYDEEDQKEKV